MPPPSLATPLVTALWTVQQLDLANYFLFALIFIFALVLILTAILKMQMPLMLLKADTSYSFSQAVADMCYISQELTFMKSAEKAEPKNDTTVSKSHSRRGIQS